MRPVIARTLLVALVGIAALGVVAANRGAEAPAGTAASQRPPTLPVLADAAPPVDATRWLNTAALDPSDLAGEVVLYEFWTFGCVNCRNVLPHVRAWHERYADDGLVVLSIHTPEFAYEADPDAVADFVRANDIAFPVALDPRRSVWRAFDNHYWPAIYLHDRQGRRRLVHIGEGSYDETEDAIRALLGLPADAPRARGVG